MGVCVFFLVGLGFWHIYCYIRYGARTEDEIEMILKDRKALAELKRRSTERQKQIEQYELEENPDYKEAMQELNRSFK
jgi:hypothetical protein